MSDKPSVKEYVEVAPIVDFDTFRTVVESRRSVRKFVDEQIPDSIVEQCLDLALLAPTSSNLQCWEFYRVVDADKKKALAEACLSQPAATTAPELIVAVARTDTWKKNSADILATFERSPWEWPRTMKAYYQFGTKIAYGTGLANLGGFGKRLSEWTAGAIRPVPSMPKSPTDMKIWAIKTTALACENLMLAFRAAGYDTCPMEGFDERRVRRVVGLEGQRHASIVMVISAGKRARGGVYGPRIRLERERFVKKI